MEVTGIVKTLNTLLGQVSEAMISKNNFISNAAHQLGNPIASILALSETVQSARTSENLANRTSDLVTATHEASRMANQLLSFERANAFDIAHRAELFDLNRLVSDVFLSAQHSEVFGDIAVTLEVNATPVMVQGDQMMVR